MHVQCLEGHSAAPLTSGFNHAAKLIDDIYQIAEIAVDKLDLDQRQAQAHPSQDKDRRSQSRHRSRMTLAIE